MIKMPRNTALSRLLLVALLLVTCACSSGVEVAQKEVRERSPATGPLRVHSSNPRYFTDGSAKAIYLTGSHTWENLKDRGTTDLPTPFDFNAYLNLLEKHGHNFIRLWTWELTKYSYEGEGMKYAAPFPWPRTGPGMAMDVKPKFNLKKFDQSYFDRLRSRVIAARDRGIYVSIMLFEGHGLHQSLAPWCWDGHPFNINNNVNGIDGDPNKDGKGLETHSLQIPAVTALQKAYVRKVIDTVNDLDNVLYEIANESHGGSDPWQQHMIGFIRSYEASKPKQHPVVYSAPWGEWDKWGTQAHAISHGWDGKVGDFIPYRDDPPVNDGKKVIFNDTDHLWGIGGNRAWVWKSFLRGLNPIYMDPYDQSMNSKLFELAKWTREEVLKAMGHTLTYSKRINLVSMIPRNDLCSTNYILADPGKEYLIYLPSFGHRGMGRLDRLGLHPWVNWLTRLIGWNESAKVNLSGSSEKFRVEWFNPRTGETVDGGEVKGGGWKSFTVPFTGDAVLYIYKL